MPTIKPLALLCALLLVGPAHADPAQAPAIVDLKAPQAIALVKEKTAAPKTTPPPLVILDVRTPEEFAKNHLAGAKNIDFLDDSFKTTVETLDKSQPYLVHCASGKRSAKTRDLMKQLGFKNIFHLDGGLAAWEKAGGPVVTSAAAQP